MAGRAFASRVSFLARLRTHAAGQERTISTDSFLASHRAEQRHGRRVDRKAPRDSLD
jgi:hypothetical protein